MNKVKVSKQSLLEKLYENKQTHAVEYAEMYDEYRRQVTKGLHKLFKASRKSENTNPKVTLHLDKPRNFEREYNQVIGMLEMSVEDTFDISQDEYNRYVLNEWSWSSGFEFSKTQYMSS